MISDLFRPELIVILVAMSLYFIVSVGYEVIRFIREVQEERARWRQWNDTRVVITRDDQPRTPIKEIIPIIYDADNHKRLKKVLAAMNRDEHLVAVPGTMPTKEDVERVLLDKGYSLEGIQDENMDGNIVVIHNSESGYHLFIDKSIIKRGHTDE